MLNRSKFITLLVLVCVWPALAWGQQEMRSSTKGTSTPLPITGTAIDADHNALDVYPRGSGPNGESEVTLKSLLACERVIEGVCVVEEHYLTIPIGGTTAMIAADQLYKSGAGYVRGISCSSDATATAGTITLRDNTAAGAGNILWEQDILAIAYTPGMIREDLQTPFSLGLYLDFTTTADVKCIVRFR